MVERVWQAYRFERFRQKGGNLYQFTNSYDNQNKARPSEFINATYMCDWLLNHQVLETILGGNAHIEIVKRAGPILKFINKFGDGKFDEETVNLLWKAQEGKFEDMVRAVYNLIEDVQSSFSLKVIDALFERIKSVPPQQYDEKYLNFLREFTKAALEKRYQDKFQQFSRETEPDDGDSAFEAMLSQKEYEIITQMTPENILQLAQQMEVTQHDYGLKIFWQIC